MAKKKTKVKKVASSREKTYGGFTQFQLIVIFSVFIVFMAFFLM